VFGVSPSSTNKTYQAARAMLKARLARLESQKFRTDPKRDEWRAEMGLPTR
jgi:hypothetical protein